MRYLKAINPCSNLIKSGNRYKVFQYTKDWVEMKLETGYIHRWYDRSHDSDGFSYYFGKIDPRKQDSLNTKIKVI